MTTPRPGLRERKKQATRKALRDAALRLALERGPENVRVEDIADAAGVSPRTYNNYFSSREQAIVAAVTTEREARIAAAVAARPAAIPLSEAVTEAIVEQYAAPDSHDPRALLLITASPALRDAFVGTAAGMEHPLAAVIADRAGTGQLTARVISASVAAAVRVALGQWVQPADSGLVAVSGSLPELLRAALAPLAPALDAAGGQRQRETGQASPRGPSGPVAAQALPPTKTRRPDAALDVRGWRASSAAAGRSRRHRVRTSPFGTVRPPQAASGVRCWKRQR